MDTHATQRREGQPDKYIRLGGNMTQEHPVQTVRLDNRSLRRFVVVALALWVALQIGLWLFGVTQNFLFMLLLSWLLAIAMEPPVAALERRGMKRGGGAGIVLAVLLITVTGFMSAFGGLFFGQLAAAVQALPDVINSTVDWVNHTFNAKINAAVITDQLSLTPDKVASIASSVAGGVMGVVSSIVAFIFETLTILMFAFYISAESHGLRRTVASWLRPDRQMVFIKVWDITVAKTGGFVVSRMILAAISAGAHVLAFWLIGVPYWMPLGLFAGITSQFIPTFGTYIGIIVPVAFAAVSNPIDCLWIAGFATVYQQIENYVLGPRVSRATMDLHPALALASVFIGAEVFGPIGALIGIPLAAALLAVVDTYGKRYELVPELAVSEDDE